MLTKNWRKLICDCKSLHVYTVQIFSELKCIIIGSDEHTRQQIYDFSVRNDKCPDGAVAVESDGQEND